MNSNPMYMEYVDDADPQQAPRRGWRILGWVCIGLSAVMVAGSLTAYGLYRRAFGNISHEDVNAQLGPNRPKKLNSAMNILLLGSDTREGANAKYGRRLKNEPPRSDTMILLHLSPGGGQAMGISFPRDLMVRMPSCKGRDGRVVPAQSRAQINSAFTNGGAACVIKTIESISNIRVDHFMQVDFNGFKAITNAVGGVPVCLPKAVNDPQSKLKLGRGRHNIKGETALAYVRVRHGLGDGSDLDRIKRQQKFMGALANKAMSAGVLSNPKKALDLMNAVTKSLTTDKELTPQVMMDIAREMQGMTSGKLRFVTVPSGPDPLDRNRVALSSAAQPFFAAVRNDRTIPKQQKPGASTIPPSQIRVRVYNGSGIDGQAGRVAADLESQGFHVEVGGNAPSVTSATRVLYGSGADQQALSLAALIPSKPQPTARNRGATPGVVDLVVGRDWTKLNNAGGGIPKQQGEISASEDICKET
ncbi:LytR family transcriptional attenuator [Actinomadura pelletieri DSM 43383]|uniref:LytR family transcriptional attenuator n=1 Tax=Actinomadura pelletieri DSM 43383 TaxID=1120940 RepID=A0A495QS82_9ACTN|nr:LCP family protein [Actinomadura pelletieri]RKS76359.1 LytR family transcriptional attenuator [Actinomadura pelletieri DSM 43383]